MLYDMKMNINCNSSQSAKGYYNRINTWGFISEKVLKKYFCEEVSLINADSS